MANGPDHISKIAVRGFKSIADEQQIELRPLTLLAGANSSGKSSLMQPVLLLKQTLEAPSDPGPLLLDGPNVHFTSAEQLLSKIPREGRTSEFGVAIELSNHRGLEVAFRGVESLGFEVIATSSSDGAKSLRIVPNMSHDDIVNALAESLKGHWANGGKTGISKRPPWSVHRERCFL